MLLIRNILLLKILESFISLRCFLFKLTYADSGILKYSSGSTGCGLVCLIHGGELQ